MFHLALKTVELCVLVVREGLPAFHDDTHSPQKEGRFLLSQNCYHPFVEGSGGKHKNSSKQIL